MSGSKDNDTLFSGKWLDVKCQQGHEFIVRKRCSGIVIIIAITPQQELLLVEQERIPVGARVLELPAGLVGDEDGRENETKEEAAKKELLEETGWEAKAVRKVTEGPIISGISSESLTFFYADDLRYVDGGGGNDHEDISVHKAPLANLEPFIRTCSERGMQIDPKIFIGAYFAAKAGL